MKTEPGQLKLLTSKTPKHNFEAFPFGLYECSSAAETAMYYGFVPISDVKSSDLEPEVKKAMAKLPFFFNGEKNEHRKFNFQEKAELIKMYRENRIPSLPHPTLLFYEKAPVKVQHSSDTYKHQCSLECIGVKRGVAEALIIQAAFAILEEEGFNNLLIELNSLGETDSRYRFELALNQYVRAHIPVMPDKMREQCKETPYALFAFNDSFAKQLQEEAPQPIAYLSENSRSHFREVLEYLEALELPYTINNTLTARKNLQSDTIFRIIEDQDTKPKGRPSKKFNELVSGYGMRYTPIAKPIGFRREVPAVGIYLVYKTSLNNQKRRARKNKINPKFSFVHLGFEAKLKSLQLINTLRKKRIPLCHSLTKDKLGPQMTNADRLQLPYLIIMGQKEALEDTVLIRSVEDRSQETVPISQLPYYLRTLK